MTSVGGGTKALGALAKKGKKAGRPVRPKQKPKPASTGRTVRPGAKKASAKKKAAKKAAPKKKVVQRQSAAPKKGTVIGSIGRRG